MLPWRFVGTELTVAVDPPPARSQGHRRIIHTPPGYDGISAAIPDGRLPTRISVTILAGSYSAFETLSALLGAGPDGDLEVPQAGDAWVYADAFVEGEPTWEQIAHEDLGPEPLYRARVTFVCPKPRPTWKSSGERVF